MRIGFAALTLCLLSAAVPVQGASFSTSCGAYVPGANPAVADFVSPCAISAPQGSASAEADAGYGLLRGEAQVSFIAGGSTYANAEARFLDEFTVGGDPGLAGQIGTMTVEFYLQGFLDATGSGRSSLFAQVEYSNPYPDCSGCGPYYALQVSSSATGTTGPRTFNQVVEGDIVFRFGETTQITGLLQAVAQRASGQTGAGTAEVLFGDTIYWNGIKEIRGPDGSILTGFDLTSASGIDYRTSAISQVPVPGALWLMVTGLVAAFSRRSVRRGSRESPENA
jgi:hypothetical protein